MKLTVIDGEETKQITFEAPALLSSLLEGSSHLSMPCGGKQRCLKCKVQATGNLSPLSVKEENLLNEHEKQTHTRFACMAEALGDVTVTLTKSNGDKILTAGTMPDIKLLPWGKEYGVAVDIGTTTIAAYLYCLKDGKLLQSNAKINPQTAFGADVITRIEKSLNGESTALSNAVVLCINELIENLCSAQSIKTLEIDSLSITGNTAMLLLLTNRSPKSLAAAPFVLDCFFGEFLAAAELGLPLPDTKVYLSRCISSYVGGDITTAILASGVYSRPKPTLLVDIGTNGEMALCTDGRILCCSTAAGPAFEGAGISMGMSAKDGAISHIYLNGDKLTYEVIGNITPIGICGSGMIDAIAVMLDIGIIEDTGYLTPDGHAFAKYVTDDGFTLPGTKVIISQADIRAIQLGKSAICAGILALIKSAGIEQGELDKLVIAGGFGSFMDVQSAQRIGLIPHGFAEKAVSIGNAAAMGGAMALLSTDQLKYSEEISRKAETIELSTDRYFMDEYINNMMF